MSVFVTISTVKDGNMYIPEDQANSDVVSHRREFLAKHSLTLEQASRVNVSFDTADFKRYIEVGQADFGKGMRADDIRHADALITKTKNHALFLPLADCVGAAIYDPDQEIIMLSHIGRHSLEQNGAYESIRYLVNQYGSNPHSLKIWLTPSPAPERYPLWKFDNRAFKDVVREQLDRAGIVATNIIDNPADSTTDPRYFSHSEFLAGRRGTDGRYGIVVVMRDKDTLQ